MPLFLKKKIKQVKSDLKPVPIDKYILKFRAKNFRDTRKSLTLVHFLKGEILSVINIKLNG